jgi:hypothetical protein
MKYKICKCHYDSVNEHQWGPNARGYVAATINGKQVTMHRYVMGNGNGLDIDHINGNKLDNRCSNLRFCTRSQNLANSTKKSGNYKGVGYFKNLKKWRARITIDYKEVHIGLFNNEGEAAAAYDSVAQQLFGEYARTNFSNKN